MKSSKKKKILIIGATAYFIDVIRECHRLGVMVVMTDYNPNAIAKKYADVAYDIDTTDKEAILSLAQDEEVDGVFVSWSDINLYTALYVCEQLKLPFYASRHQLDCSVNKDLFKEMCIRNGVPVTRRYNLTEAFLPDDLLAIKYPVIIKPVDSAGTRGISVCEDEIELKAAYRKALTFSKRGKVIVEQFLENEGKTFSVKYLIREGEPRLLSMGDRKVLNSEHGVALITSSALYPSIHLDDYIQKMDEKVKAMLRTEGFRNGQLFIEGIYSDGVFYFYEMGYRLSGGITYRITDALTGVNGMRMLVNYALTGEMCSEEAFSKVDPYMNGGYACSFAILMKQGTIQRIVGVEAITALPEVIDITEYYKVGQTVEEKDIGNVGQMYARLTVLGKNKETVIETIHTIIETIHIFDVNGSEMIVYDLSSLPKDEATIL